MRCDQCQGLGRVVHRVNEQQQRIEGICHECEGSGIVSCCEGSARHGQLGEAIGLPKESS